MRKVLHKVKSHWIVLGVMGATVVALGAADVQKVSAAEVEGAGVIETNQAATSLSVSYDPVTFSMEETLGEEVPNNTVELADSNFNESLEAVLEEGVATPQNDTPAISYIGELEENVASSSVEETVVATNEDVIAPVIDASSIKVSQTTATLGETITLSVNITDDVGVTEVKAQYYLPTGIKTIVNLYKNEITGLYEGTITVDNSTQSGNWRLNRLIAYDAAGNSTSSDTDYSNLSAANFSVTGTTVDSRNPVIYPESVKVSQTSVTAGDTVIVSANITDDVGVTYGAVSYQSPTGLWSSVELFKNETSGLYEGRINVDASTQSGEWKFGGIVARDAAGNSLYIRSYDCDFSAAGFTVTTDGNDVTNPIIDVSSIKVSQPSAVPGDTITVSANLTDNVGVTLGRAFYKDPTGSLTSVNLFKNEITGFYEGMIAVDEGTFSGNWILASIDAYDAAGNVTSHYKGEVNLSAANFTISGTLNVVSPPVIDGTSINVSQKSAIPGNLITVSAKLTDDADVREVLAMYYSPTEVISGTILSKNEISGLFEGTIYVDNHTQEGTWNIDSIVVFYNTGGAAGFYRDDVDFSAASFTVTGTYASIIPVLDASSIKVSQPSAAPGDTITVSAKLTNDEDVEYLLANYYYSPTNYRMSVNLYENEISGLYEGMFSINQLTQSGDWKLISISVFGAAGNLASFFDYDFTAGNFVVPSSSSETLEITETIAYGKKKIEDPALPIGETIVIQPGMNGSKKNTYRVTYIDGVETKRELIKTITITAPITEVIKVGTQPNQNENIATGATLSSSVPFDNSSFATDAQADNTAEYARGTNGLQWVQMDLGAAYDLNEIQLWHYYGDGRSYRDVVVQLSNDATFANGAVTVFNNDTNGSAGLGLGTDSEYSETSAGKTIVFDTTKARYARFYSNGSTVNGA
ncbi:G5 domain-containing protein, partial [Trichococcus alkaliphilus]|uniref:G5 domain-containing protein n=1 Tax=Trichococcus alkaliphilus TaxID=2052943 RepID=UPI001863E637